MPPPSDDYVQIIENNNNSITLRILVIGSHFHKLKCAPIKIFTYTNALFSSWKISLKLNLQNLPAYSDL